MKSLLTIIIFTIIILPVYSQSIVYVNGAGSSVVNTSYFIVSDADVPYYRNVTHVLYHYNNTHWVIGTSNGQSPSGQDVYYWVESNFPSPLGLVFTNVGNLGVSPLPTVNNSVLPVELISFNIITDLNRISLHWETATETNNYGFEIERKNETEPWIKLGFVEGNGNSNSPKYYSFKDVMKKPSGKYLYRLKQIDNDGNFDFSAEIEVLLNIPDDFELSQNYPNPFNPSTTIEYTIPENTAVELKVFDILGKEIWTLVNEVKAPGKYEVLFEANNLSTGIYYYRMQAGDFVDTRKLILLK